ncbi:histidinol phosphate phosphatase domain-containing protein [Deferribacter autotrophicus]|uniref:Histidinol phosphate phosphatase domain-containing protein n=1 Tax=Deferribacter autotrophicus TaxID=500465 RepID=A0A5A8F3G2_9BACT|nr:histidinol phosphate phosphatase domain-containing protein [Deferribacter autotrophicus]KAA0258056.1 histidinol phosphate phosphatase domain-containing protein [Deferribacter autotrophicus]
MFYVDLHTHTTFSDGVLIPAELARRAKVLGYSGIAITDHADSSNYLLIIENLLRFKDDFNNGSSEFKVIVGVELTHVLPSQIEKLTFLSREAGADIVLVHGETIVEPVEEDTNRAAIDACVDILAHPGLITEELVKKAKENGVHLEITTRKGHSLTNAHVAKLALKYGAKLVVNNDFHTPGDYFSVDMLNKTLVGAGLDEEMVEHIFQNNKKIFTKCLEG